MPHLKIMPSFTQRLLQACLDAWQPELWFFGHHHRTGFSMQIDKTTFRCLGELEHYDLEY